MRCKDKDLYYFFFYLADSFINKHRFKQSVIKMENEEISSFRPLILVAEDDDSNFKLIQAIIGKRCDILWAHNGQEMVELYQAHRETADAILMDVKMPVMNGFDATALIRDAGATLPIIMQTAYAFSSDRERAIGAGASEVLVKPITVSILRTCLSQYLPGIVW